MAENVTPEGCTHDCSTCGENCPSKTMKPEDFLKPLNPASSVKKVYAVMSGKGGVGKSLVTSMLACKTSKQGYKVGILDADITGPSIPKAFGCDKSVGMTPDGLMIPTTTATGIDIMSTNLLLENETDPVIWRGPMIGGVVEQFWTDTLWDNIDYMYVDMPPGTGDVPLTVFQSLPVDGIIVVTSPQELVGMIVAKAVRMANEMNKPLVGIVENMSYFECPDCGKKHAIYGESHIEEIAKEYGIPVLAKIPVEPKIAQMVDKGLIELLDMPWFDNLEQRLFTI